MLAFGYARPIDILTDLSRNSNGDHLDELERWVTAITAADNVNYGPRAQMRQRRLDTRRRLTVIRQLKRSME